MNENVIFAAALVGAVAGGALGAWFSQARVWKGALLTGLATIIQTVIGELVDIEQPFVGVAIYLLAAGLIGGRWGMRLTAHQLTLVVIGSFLLALVTGIGTLYLVSSFHHG